MQTYLSYYTPRIRSLWIMLALTTLWTLLFTACGGTSSTPTSPGPTVTVTLHPASTPAQTLTPIAVANVKIVKKNGQYAFDPASLKIKVGTQVIWTNESETPHTVTSDTGVFTTPNPLEAQQMFKVIFTKPGRYTYYCNIHL